MIQLHAKGVACVKTPSFADEMFGQIGIHLPWPLFVGMGQRAARNRAAKSHSVKLGGARAQTDFDVTQALAIGQLRKGEAEKLIPAGKALHFVVAAMTDHDPVKSLRMNPVHELGENHFGQRHNRLLYPRLPDRVDRLFIGN